MIITIIGGIGSGKTLSVIKRIVDDKESFPITNFRLKNIKSYHRLKMSDILISDDEDKLNVNWEFWEDIRKRYKKYSIYLDEAHNVIGSRSSMSKQNQLMSRWVSQIRKILSDSKDNHIYIITQKPRRIDVNFRELCQIAISCQKIMTKSGKCFIMQKYYDGLDSYDYSFNRFLAKAKAKSYFVGNNYFKYYDTNEMVRFKDGEEYI